MLSAASAHKSWIVKSTVVLSIGGLVVLGANNADTSAIASNQVVLDGAAQQQLDAHLADITGIEDGDSAPGAAENYSATIEKQQIIETDDASRYDIITHTVKDGESISDIAKHYGLSENTVKWSNDNITSVSAGDKLKLPPINGILYEVQKSDSVKDLAEKYDANADYIVAFNDIELSGLKKGMKIVIPEGKMPAPTPSSSGSRSYTSYASSDPVNYVPNYGGRIGNGQCTDYTIFRRAQLGRPIPRWGNASAWASAAAASGYKVNKSPAVGAVIQNGWVYGMTMHVGVVEEIRSDGSLRISEQNYPRGAGPRSDRIIPADHVTRYNYIH